MPNYSGVSGYKTVKITLDISFPIDRKGVPHVACCYCSMYGKTGNICNITKLKCFGAEHGIDGLCPLREALEGDCNEASENI